MDNNINDINKETAVQDEQQLFIQHENFKISISNNGIFSLESDKFNLIV